VIAVPRPLVHTLGLAFILSMGAKCGRTESRLYPLDITRGRRGRGFIAITFDGGGNLGATRFILDILRDRDVRCTIFLTGRFIRQHRQLVLRMVREGHEIGNHTYSHPHLTTWSLDRSHTTRWNVTREVLYEELRKTEDEFYEATGRHMSKFWRAPYGERNEEIMKWAEELGYTHVGWTSVRGATLDCLDWVSDPSSRLYLTSEQIKEKILGFPDLDGAIVLMHLGSERPYDPVYRKLPEIIDELRRRGYEFTPVSTLLEDS